MLGGVFVVPATSVDTQADKKETNTVVIVCETLLSSTTKQIEPILQNGVPVCGSNTQDLTLYRKN